jgi:hypothetical protein
MVCSRRYETIRHPECRPALPLAVLAPECLESHLLRALETFRAQGIEFVSFSEQLDTRTPAGKASPSPQLRHPNPQLRTHRGVPVIL